MVTILLRMHANHYSLHVFPLPNSHCYNITCQILYLTTVYNIPCHMHHAVHLVHQACTGHVIVLH